MVGLQQYRTEVLCPCGCGWPREMTLVPDEGAFTVPAPSVCRVTRTLVDAQKAWGEAAGHENTAGYVWSVYPKQDPTTQ